MAENYKHFIGQDGFQWFVGVCEDRDDPQKLGRIRVRVFGHHTELLHKLPTQDLPWSMVMLPPTVKIGETPNIKPGDWVFGFWKDPDFKQESIIFGVVPGIPRVSATGEKGFEDPNSELAPDVQKDKYKSPPDYGPYPIRLDEPDTSRLSSGYLETHPEIAERDSAATVDVPIANVDTKWSELKTTDATTRGEDAIGTNPETSEERTTKKRRDVEYPYNHAVETESGHIFEVDDTPYAERIYEKHRSGTFKEIDADGNKVTRVVGDNYEIVAGNDYVNIKGTVNLTIDSDCNTYIKGNWNVQVDGNKTEVIKGTYDQDVTGNITVDGKTINLNNGTNGAARINDTVDTGDDPAGISGSDGSNIVETGSGTVFIGD